MAYIGQGIKQGTFKVLDTSGNTYNGSNTTFSLGTQVGSAAQLLVSHDGVIQKAGTDYTLATGGTQITFSTAPASGASIFITEISGAVGGTVTPSDASVTSDKIADTAVTSAKLNSAFLTGHTDIGANIADADLFLTDDGAGGTLRKTAASRLKTYVGAGAGAFSIANLDIDGGTDIGADIVDADLLIIDDGAGGTNRKTTASRLKTYIGGGTLVQTGRTVISGGNPSGIDVNSCFSSTYDTYLVVIDRIESTVDSQTISFRLRDSGGSVTGSNYRHGNRFFDDDGSGVESQDSNARNKFDFTNDTDDSSNNGGLQGIMYVHRPADANTMTRMNAHYSFFDSTANDLKVAIATCNYDNPEEHTGIGINISSGGIRDGGSLTVYGIKYS
jgi:hypothetical protein